MTDKFWDAEEVEGSYIEVMFAGEDSEFVYWVDLGNKPEDEDEHDWSISIALKYHNSQIETPKFETDDAEAYEPFSRNESEFTFIKGDD